MCTALNCLDVHISIASDAAAALKPLADSFATVFSHRPAYLVDAASGRYSAFSDLIFNSIR